MSERADHNRQHRRLPRVAGLALGVLACVGMSSFVFRGGLVARADTAASALPPIAVVLSYDDAYQWQADIKVGIVETVGEDATLLFHNLDTLGVSAKDELARLGREAIEWVSSVDADALIVADDNAMRYVAEVGGETLGVPIVFCGVNWPADSYDLPRANVSGMVEISPAEQVLRALRGTLRDGDRAVIIGAARPTDRAQARGFTTTADAAGLEVGVSLVTTFEGWKQAFVEANADADLVYVLNNAGIAGWDDDEATALALRSTETLTVSEYAWMGPIVVIGATKAGQEQGAWAAGEALRRARNPGVPAGPIMVNREVRYDVNEDIVAGAGLEVPRTIELLGEARR